MKIQELSVKQRTVILWGTVVILGGILFFLWGGNVIETFKTVSLPKIPKELGESLQQTKEEFTIPSFEAIEISEEVLKELQEYGQSTGQ